MTEESLFHEVLAKLPAERASFLERACTEQPELRAAVEALLAAHEAPKNMLDRSPNSELVGTLDHTPPLANGDLLNATSSMHGVRAAPGLVIAGRYTLLERIGEGGMGEVWVAKQTEPVKRKVALKLIKAGTDSKEVLARFEQERQALALMDHPNIARVLDGGATPSGHPFFVMELVKGARITDYCDANRLTPRQRLELFVPVCQAIQHAHQKGVIHRDVKPSNVMVALYDDRPVPKVIDFGVAKATGQSLTDQTLNTAFGGVVGTPEYMSPEQASLNNLDVDTRSDIYSLGVLLYELLAGSPPFRRKELEKAGLFEILRIIREDEPPRPSTKLSTAEALPSLSANRGTEPKKLTGMLRNELDWIVMKALEKDRARRYDTANGFAADILRYLSGEPVNAHPPSTAYRVSKFLRKHQGAAIATALVVFALIAGTIGTSLGMFWAVGERKLADAARNAEARQRQIAEAETRKAQRAEADILADYRASTDDAIGNLIGSKATLGPLERAYLDKALNRWQAFAARQGDDRESRAIRAEGHFRIGVIWDKLGEIEKAKIEFQKARDIQKSLTEEAESGQWGVGSGEQAKNANASNPQSAIRNPQFLSALAQTHHNLGNLLDRAGNHADSRAEHLAALALRKRLVEQFPDSTEHGRDLAASHNSLGSLLIGLGKLDNARVEYESARDVLEKLSRRHPDDAGVLESLAFSHNSLGGLYRDLGKPEITRDEYAAARDLRKRLVEGVRATPERLLELSRVQNNLANALVGLRQYDEAKIEFESSLAIKSKLVAEYPAVPDYRYHLAISHNDFGGLKTALNKLEEARAQDQTSLDHRKKLVDQYPANPEYRQDLAQSYNNLGYVLARLGKFVESEAQFEASQRVRSKLVQEFPEVPVYRRDLANTISTRGTVLARIGKAAAARTEFRTAIEHQKKLVELSPKSPDYAVELGGSCCNFGVTLGYDDKHAESLEWFELAIRTLQAVVDQSPKNHQARQYLRNSLSARAQAFDHLAKPALAAKDWGRAVELSPLAEQLTYRAGRANSLMRAGQTDAAVDDIVEMAFPKSSVEVPEFPANAWFNFARVLAVTSGKATSRKDEFANRAVELLQRAAKAGYQDAKHLSEDRGFDSLRARPDFKRLLDEMKSNGVKKP